MYVLKGCERLSEAGAMSRGGSIFLSWSERRIEWDFSFPPLSPLVADEVALSLRKVLREMG